MNVGSIANVEKLMAMVKAQGYEIETIQALETYSYGFDEMRETQHHFMKEIPNNSWRRDRFSRKIRYLILGLTLKKSSNPKCINRALNRLRGILSAYKGRSRNKESQMRRIAEASNGFLTFWALDRRDEERIRTFRDPYRLV